MGAIFLEMDGLEKASALMLRRTLLELAAIRRAVGGECSVPLRHLLADAGLSDDPKEVSLALRAVAQNNVVFVDHQDMYDTFTLGATLGHDVAIECNPRLVKKWVSGAGGGPDAYTFDAVPRGVRDKIVDELDDRIGLLKEHLPRWP